MLCICTYVCIVSRYICTIVTNAQRVRFIGSELSLILHVLPTGYCCLYDFYNSYSLVCQQQSDNFRIGAYANERGTRSTKSGRLVRRIQALLKDLYANLNGVLLWTYVAVKIIYVNHAQQKNNAPLVDHQTASGNQSSRCFCPRLLCSMTERPSNFDHAHKKTVRPPG
jgi:hypothetical protein